MSNGHQVKIKFSVAKTVFDGECVNASVGNRTTQKCPIFFVIMCNFANEKEDFTPVEVSLTNGINLIQCAIKKFDQFLYIAYKQTAKSWDVTLHAKHESNDYGQ